MESKLTAKCEIGNCLGKSERSHFYSKFNTQLIDLKNLKNLMISSYLHKTVGFVQRIPKTLKTLQRGMKSNFSADQHHNCLKTSEILNFQHISSSWFPFEIFVNFVLEPQIVYDEQFQIKLH